MGRLVRVAGIQMGACSLKKEENVAQGLQLLDKACKEYQPHIVCFNELFQTYFFAVKYFEDTSQFFETIPGPTTDRLSEKARQFKISIIAGMAEINKGGEQYNTAVVISADGNIVGRYRKAQMPLNVSPLPYRKTCEKNYFREGNLGFPVFQLPEARIGITICYDRHFPEPFRVMSLNGAEIIFLPTAARTWRKQWRSEMWQALLRTRAYENCVYLVAVNKAGQEDETVYLGQSMIISPLGGKILAMSEKDDFDIIFAELDLDKLQEARDELPVNRDRRPEFYSILSQTNRV